ncbi:MAG: uroporphyrinogen decarboxylase family protein [candidate division NC10 bacterium]|nr:uroporphyrinogen decarboxylase family protein [candidate division NC10 bacterium]
MESKEIVLEALSLGRPPRTPVSVWGGGMWTARVMGATLLELSQDPDQMAKALEMALERAPFDILFIGSGYPPAFYEALGGKLRFEGISAPKLEGPVLKELGEARKLPLEKLQQNPILRTVRSAAFSLKRSLGSRAFRVVVANGPFTFAGQLLGVNQLMLALLDAPDRVQELVEISVRAICLFLEPLLEERIVDGVALADPTSSGDLISRANFEEFSLPAIHRLSRWVKEREAHLLLHICGNTADRLDLIAGSGIHCFSLDHKVNLASAQEILEGKVCLAGNVDPVETMLRGSERQVEEKAKECLEIAAPKGGYILMTGCDLPPEVPLENVKALLRAARG